ncbi:MAG: protein kinase [bacterium]|nr:protein kinase [bacterium]
MVEAVEEKKSIKIGDYNLVSKIGQGGIAEIYKARQASLNREVAIKILSAEMTEDKEIVRRFERESIVVAGLNHPNIVHVIDKGVTSGRYYFVMEYIDGTSMREVIDSSKIPLKTKLEAMVQVCKALDYAHKNGVIHRDIKPANILIDKQGNALVADFGIAQMVGSPDSEMTATDMIMGTLAYMSPEQKISSTNVDQTTDIYAMGVILYEILLGKKPMGHFKLPSELESSIDWKFDAIIQKCLAPEAKDRFQTAVELKDALLEGMNADSSLSKADDYNLEENSDSFMGKCRYLDTIKETRFSSTILVENKVNKRLYVIRKHSRGEVGRKEANILRSIKHKNIVNVFGSGGDNKSTVIISEYAPGGSLADRMVRHYSWEKAAAIVLQVATGLDFAHKNNIVHGNIRPSNVLFDSDDIAKISDFGMPAHYDEEKKRNWYAAPERKKSKSADLYALGVIFHRMIFGRNPDYDTRNNLIFSSNSNLMPQEVKSIFGKLLAIRVSNRYDSCEQFLLEWDDFEQRQHQAAKPREPIPVAAPAPEKPKSQVWKYLSFGAVMVVLEWIILYATGMFK